MAAAVASRSDSKRKYSWWWDSHISPKNSKWLQENLTDMDAKVKQMIKLIEEDADSFARRAEMYYKKRPELMKMVEEFYRAYRALAERYDHATGVIRQAHRTMSENQIAFVMGDDMPTGSVDDEPRTPEMPSTRAPLDPEELPKDALGISPSPQAIKRNGAFTEEHDTASSRKGLKQLNDLFGFTDESARKQLNFHDAKEEDQNLQDENEIRPRIPSDSEQMGKAEMEILTLKNALAKLEAEKEAGLRQYQQSLERLSNLESKVSHAKDDSQGLNERASKAEAEVQTLKEALAKLEADRESSFLQYQQCLEKIAKLEFYISHAEKDVGELTERASKAEAEAESLKLELSEAETEKADALLQYKQCLEKIAALENKLLHAEDDAMMFKERAEGAEREVEILKQAVTKLTEEKEAAAIQHQQCLDTISELEHKLATVLEETQRLSSEIDYGVVKLKGGEENCILFEKSNQTMHSELESLAQKTAAQSEDALVSHLQVATDNLEKLKKKNIFLESSLFDASAEIEGLRIRLEEMEKERQSPLHEIKELQSNLDAQKRKYASLVRSSKSQLDKLERKIHFLQEEGHRLKKKHEDEQLNKEFSSQIEVFILQQCVQDLEENNFSVLLEFQKLLEASRLSEKLIAELEQENLEQQIEVRSLYDQLKGLRMGFFRLLKTLDGDSNQWYQGKSQQDQKLLNLTFVKLQAIQKMLLEMQDEKQQLLVENSVFVTLLGQLQLEFETLLTAKDSLHQESTSRSEQYLVLQTENKKLLEMNEVLSLKILEGERREESLKVELKNTEEELLALQSNSRKLSEMNEMLNLKIREGDQKEEVLKVELKNLQGELLALQSDSRKHLEMNEVLSLKIMEGERRKEGLKAELNNLQGELLDLQSDRRKLSEMNEVLNLKIKEGDRKEEVLKVELKNLQGELLDLQSESNKVSETNEVLSLKIMEGERREEGLKVELKNMEGELLALRSDCRKHSEMNEVLSLKIMEGERREEGLKVEMKNMEGELLALRSDSRKLSEMTEVLSLKSREGDHKEEVLKVELKNLQGELLDLQNDKRKLSEMNEALSLKIREADHKEEVLKVELKNLQGELLDLQGSYKKLQEESRKMLEEEITLKNIISQLREEKSDLEDENCAIFAEQASLGILSLILRDIISVNYMEIKELRTSHEKLCSVNDNLNVKLKLMEEKVRELSVIQDEKSELHITVGHLKSKCDEVERKEADQEKKMMILSSDYDAQRKMLERIHEEKLKLKSELQLLNEELVEAKSREEISNREILKGQDEIEHWESQAAALYGDLLIYAVNQALFEGKIHELIEAFKDLEGRNSLKDLEIEHLKERIRPLESENEELKAQMMSYVPAFISLSDSVTSLENQTLSNGELHEVDKEAKDDKFGRHAEGFQKVSKEQGAVGADGNLDWQTLQMRIRAIEEAVMERERAFILEISNANSKLGAAIGQLEDVKSRKDTIQEPVAGVKKGNQNMEDNKPDHEKSKSANEVMTKDIILDQISESPSYVKADDQMLEIWETAEKDPSIDLTKKKHRAYTSRESMLEKDVSVDKLEISRRMSGSRQEVAERLDSDAQKLTNLRITVQDLKKKVEVTERNRKQNGMEYDSVKEQLEESDETIAKLSDANRRLKQSIEDESFFSDESGSVRRRKVSEESEKIGRLQMEVEKLQFLVMKLDEVRGKTKIVERSARVLLRDYLHGGTRNGQRKKRWCLCACVQPATKGD